MLTVTVNMLMVAGSGVVMQRGKARDMRSEVDIDPDRHLSYVIAKVSHQLERTIDRALAGQQITLTQFSALAHIAGSPALSGGDLSRALLISPQATATLVRRMADAGFVDRTTGGAGLASAIRLTDRGIRKLREAEAVATAAESEALGELPAAEQRRLASTLGRLLSSLEGQSG